MKKITAISFLLVMACNTSQSPVDKSSDIKDAVAANETKIIILAGCYSWVLNKDSARMELRTKENELKGSLNYNLYEKDRNTGTFTGSIQDDLIIGWYNFKSEGMMSVRQVVFKIQGQQLLEGFGDVVMSGDSAKFANIISLQFHKERPFIKGDCR